jgi:phosphoglucosamine mutase
MSTTARKKRLFGTDGVRGVANHHLTADFALRLGSGVGAWIRSKLPTSTASNSGRPIVVIGRDTRISCDMLESALAAGLAGRGIDVHCIGTVPTPAVSHCVGSLMASAGFVISASHNPYHDNGIKLFGPDGRKLPDCVEDEIEEFVHAREGMPYSQHEIGSIVRSARPVEAYIAHVCATAATAENPHPLKGMSIVLDCANGAAYEAAPAIFEQLGAEVALLHASPDGVNINVNCGSTHPESMAHAVKALNADAGLAFDGDADRVILSDENGDIVNGDRIIAIIARQLHHQGLLHGNVVVTTIMSNVGLEIALESDGIKLHRTAVGDRYVSAGMEELHASIGGEQSGHVLLPHLTPTGDGLVTGLQVLRVMRESGKKLSELASIVQDFPQRLDGVKVSDTVSWATDTELQDAIRQSEGELGKPEWLSVRASGTEPLIRVMAQGTDRAVVDSIVDRLTAIVKSKYAS